MEQTWNESLSVNNKLLDEQHMMLIAKANELIVAAKSGVASSVIPGMIDFLRDYSVNHFCDEEKYLCKKNYPDVQSHRCIHKKFIESIDSFKERFLREGVSKELEHDLRKQVSGWIINHIAGLDKKYAEYIATLEISKE